VKDAAADSRDGSDAASDVAVEAAPSTALLQVNELTPNVTGGEDLIELYATRAGDTTGIDVEQDITTKLVLVSGGTGGGSSIAVFAWDAQLTRRARSRFRGRG
jgi:hypothetical protein